MMTEPWGWIALGLATFALILYAEFSDPS